jgi:hypothetical protein
MPSYVCHWTGKTVSDDQVVWTGGVIPNVKARYPAAPGYEEARKESVRLFHESERNCNTCRYLSRVPHEKNKAGFLRGKCTNSERDLKEHPYRHLMNGDVMAFHPDDPMHMPCYESRYANR